MSEQSAHDIVAFAIVNLNVPLPLDTLYSMTLADPLYKSLVDAFKDKQRRDDYRTALLCSIVANCSMSGGKYTPKDFMPQDAKTAQEDSELKVRQGFMQYAASNNKK